MQARTEAFLRDFFAKGEELVRELIEENDRLRPPRWRTAGRGDSHGTTTTIERLSRQIAALEAECAELRRLAAGVRGEGAGGLPRAARRPRAEHYRLAAMYVAGDQFHRRPRVEDVLRTITEILLNFVGVGRFTVFVRRRGATDDCSRCCARAGPVDESARCRCGAGRDRRGRRRGGAVDGGRSRWARPPRLLMHLPLCSGTRLVGMARIEKFLPQKQRFDEGDFGLLELVSEHAGVGIETAWIRAHAREVPLSVRALERLVGS